MSLGETANRDGLAGAFRVPQAIQKRLNSFLSRNDGAGKTQRAALFAFLIRVVSAGIAYFSQVLLARWMGSFEYGIYVFVWVWVLILGGLAPLGLSTASTRFISEYRETGQLDLLRGLLLRARVIAVLASTAIAILGYTGLTLFSNILTDYYLGPALLILFCLPMYTLVDVQDGIARAFPWMSAALVPPYILRPLLLLGAMLGIYVAGGEMSALNAAGAAVFTCWVSAILQTFLLERKLRQDTGPGPRAYKTGFWMRTSLPLLLFSSFALLLQNTDILVLSRYEDPSQVAVYFAALKTISLVAFVHFAIGAASASRFSALNARGNMDELQSSVRDAVKWTFWPSLAATLILLILGKPLLWLFGEQFTSGYPVMFVMALGLMIRAAVGPVELILNMLGQQKFCALALFGSVGLNLGLNFALIPSYGLMGAASATAISMAAAAISMALAVRKKLGLNCFIWQRSQTPGSSLDHAAAGE